MAADTARAMTCSALSNAIRGSCISVNRRNLRLPERSLRQDKKSNDRSAAALAGFLAHRRARHG
jgi:hypothetical protein